MGSWAKRKKQNKLAKMIRRYDALDPVCQDCKHPKTSHVLKFGCLGKIVQYSYLTASSIVDCGCSHKFDEKGKLIRG